MKLNHNASVILIFAAALLAGCVAGSETIPSESRKVALQDFTTRSDVDGALVLEVPSEVTAMPDTVTESRSVEVGDTDVTETTREIIATAPGIGPEVASMGEIEFDERVRVGRRWPIDGLVGQINGRPVFAAEFFVPIEDRLLNIGRQGTPEQTRAAILEIVRQRFNQFVNSELVIAEAESDMTPQMQEGLFGWLADLKQEVTAQRGGTSFGAEQSLLDETGLNMEEYIEQQRKLGLAGQLLRQKVEPRAIVSWRDVEQAYQAELSTYQPPRKVRIGRILLLNSRDGMQIEATRQAFANGDGFTAVARELGVKDDGLWRTFTLEDGSIAGITDLAQTVRDALESVRIDEATRAVEGRSSTSWYSILAYETPPTQSIFDSDVQLLIRNQLESFAYDTEESNYLNSLRRRWVNDDIRKMEIKLMQLALRRYWQG
ncbi:MAG: hypothetical protein CMJ33_10365 [Phycisphaerae bacterium]|nr:hypothetical protein [Phycisphaerae bacterium]